MLPIKEETTITSKLYLTYVFLKSWHSLYANVGVSQRCHYCMGGSCKSPIVDKVKQRIPLFITRKVHIGLNPHRHPQTHKKPSESLMLFIHHVRAYISFMEINITV